MLRSSKACSTCHTRKVRCDVSEVGQPCTKCHDSGFDCTAHDRKRRQTKSDRRTGSNQVAGVKPGLRHAVPEHHMLHKFPFYSLFRNFSTRGQARLVSNDPNHGALSPMPMEDPYASQVGPGSALTTGDAHFLQQKGALNLPPRPLLDRLVQNYFRLFHAFFPVVDKEDFLAHYQQSDEKAILLGQGPSLLLLQAIIFTASSACDIPTIHAMGFSSRKHARSSLYDRCRRLYNFGYESDDIANIQALLLISQYFPSMAGQKHTWFWAHQAITLAQGIGLHRDPGALAPQRRLWIRLWWACLIRDRLIALGTRRPMHINSLDCNVPFPTLADLMENGDSEGDVAVKSIFLEFAKLCHYMEGVLSLPLTSQESLPQQITLCEEALEQWLARLGPSARRPDQGAEASEVGSVSAMYRTILHLIFNTILIVLRQSGNRLDEIQNGGQKPPSPAVQIVAEESTRLCNELIRLEMTQVCPTICVTTTLPLLACHLHILQTSNIAVGEHSSKEGFQDCLRFLQQLSEVHWHAGFYHDFFQMLSSRWFLEPHEKRPKRIIPRDQSGPSQKSGRIFQGASTNGVAGILADATLPHMDGVPPADTVSVSYPPIAREPQHQQWPTSQSLDLNFEGVMDFDNILFDGWLDDYARMQNLFPSA